MPTQHADPDARPGLKAGAHRVLENLRHFFLHDLWDRDLYLLPRLKRYFFTNVRILAIVARDFVHDKCALQASALTYISLMSMVPVLALMLSVSKGMGAQEHLMQVIGLERNDEGAIVVAAVTAAEPNGAAEESGTPTAAGDPGSDDAVSGSMAPGFLAREGVPAYTKQVVTQIFSYVDHTNFATLGIFGVLLLFWTVLKAMSRIENAFNQIWGVQEARSAFRKFTDYVSVLVVVPLLMLVATSVNATLSSPRIITRLQTMLPGSLGGSLAGLYLRGIRLSGLAFLLLAFAFLYMFMPNAKVRFRAALGGGLVGGLLWFFWQWFYIFAQGYVSSKNAIYGTFAAIPLFLAWLNTSWILVLVGAEFSFGMQHQRTYMLERTAARARPNVRQMLALVVVFASCRRFWRGQSAWSAEEFGRQHDIPARLLADVVFTLADHGILVAVADQPNHFIPGKDTGQLSVADIEQAFRGLFSSPLVEDVARATDTPITDLYKARYDRFTEELRTVRFRDLVATAEDQASSA